MLGKKETMSGIDDLLAESEDRWAKAMKRSQGVEDIGLGPALKIYYTRYVPVVLAVLIVVGSLVGTLVFGSALSDWLTYVPAGMALAAFGAIVGGLIYNAKRMVPAVHFGRLDVMFLLKNEEQKHVRHQVAGKAAVDHEHLRVIRAAAVQQRKGLATQLLIIPFYPLFFIFQATGIAVPGEPFWWITVVGAAGVMLAVVFLVRDFQRPGRFLAKTSGG
ncbi:hypothetical protein ACT3TS_18820 [Specibacter sp. AOP5-B1-6]|uniref:hypothetical protein n=1 Tax=Specibacter sp. AOP5-B1-6 TaxID=3457653 RepID=UPI00402B9148